MRSDELKRAAFKTIQKMFPDWKLPESLMENLEKVREMVAMKEKYDAYMEQMEKLKKKYDFSFVLWSDVAFVSQFSNKVLVDISIERTFISFFLFQRFFFSIVLSIVNSSVQFQICGKH
jgi:hypothetical protein